MVKNNAEVYPGNGQLADQLGYHKRTLNNAIRELEDAGYIDQSRIGKYERYYRRVADNVPDELPRPDPPEWKTEEWLKQKYVHQNMSGVEVADLAGVSQRTIFLQLHKHDIDTTYTIREGSVVCCELGSRFRSRWEHEVAHRLEEAGVEWKHEPGWIKAGGRKYLPDFICGNTVVEVKGRVYEENDQDKALSAIMKAGRRVVVVGGTEAEDLPHDEFIHYDGGSCKGLFDAVVG